MCGHRVSRPELASINQSSFGVLTLGSVWAKGNRGIGTSPWARVPAPVGAANRSAESCPNRLHHKKQQPATAQEWDRAPAAGFGDHLATFALGQEVDLDLR